MSTTRGPVIDPLKCLIVQLNETILLIHLRGICIWTKLRFSLNSLEKFQFNYWLFYPLSITPIMCFDPLSILLKTYFCSR